MIKEEMEEGVNNNHRTQDFRYPKQITRGAYKILKENITYNNDYEIRPREESIKLDHTVV